MGEYLRIFTQPVTRLSFIQELKEKDALIVKLMRSLEENEREGRALRKTIAKQEETVKEKETIQASLILRELYACVAQRTRYFSFLP